MRSCAQRRAVKSATRRSPRVYASLMRPDTFHARLNVASCMLQLCEMHSHLTIPSQCKVMLSVADNWRNGSAEALSPWFLAEWFLVRQLCMPAQRWKTLGRGVCKSCLCQAADTHVWDAAPVECMTAPRRLILRVSMQGDASNLVGCMLTGTQLPLTTTTACYFVGCDITMMVQYTYYAAKARRRQRRRQQRRQQQAMRDAIRNRQAYDDANAYAILQTQRHLAGYQRDSSRRLQSHCVHSVPSASIPLDYAEPHYDQPMACCITCALHLKLGD